MLTFKADGLTIRAIGHDIAVPIHLSLRIVDNSDTCCTDGVCKFRGHIDRGSAFDESRDYGDMFHSRGGWGVLTAGRQSPLLEAAFAMLYNAIRSSCS